jgi:hypothetical protein
MDTFLYLNKLFFNVETWGSSHLLCYPFKYENVSRAILRFNDLLPCLERFEYV